MGLVQHILEKCILQNILVELKELSALSRIAYPRKIQAHPELGDVTLLGERVFLICGCYQVTACPALG